MMHGSVNNLEFDVSTLEQLRSYLARVPKERMRELWLDRDDPELGPALCMHIHGDRAWLLYIPDKDQPYTYSSRDPAYTGPKHAVIEYTMPNGQVDEFSASWAIPREEALQAFEYYFEHQTLAPWITWHDDSQHDE